MSDEIDQESKQILNELIEQIVNKLEKTEKPLTKVKRSKDDDDYELNENTEEEDDDDDDGNNEFVFDSKCSSCNSTWSPIWRRVARTKIICNKCFFNKTYLITINDEANNNNLEKQAFEKKTRSNAKNQSLNLKRSIANQLSSSSSNSSEPPSTIDDSKTTRKSTRFNKSSKHNSKNIKKAEKNEPAVESIQTNRRNKIFKQTQPVKNEILESSIITSDYVLYKGFYYQIGDIVALFDLDDKETIYFAQIRALLTDQFGDKSAVITWLVPSSHNSSQIKTVQDFDPNLFEIGPAEEYPRSLDYMEFVCRLTNLNDKIKTDDLVRSNFKFKNDLLRHKFSLEDLATSNVKLISKLTNENSIEYQIKY